MAQPAAPARAALTLTLALTAGATIQPARAAPGDHEPTEVAQLLADCTGRLSAQLEHQWLLSQPRARETAALRHSLLDLLASVATPATARSLLAHRVEAKAAQATLLSRATFRGPSPEASRAARLARQQLAPCRALPLG